MTTPSKNAVADNMIRCGGTFIQALGVALRAADLDNAQKIKDTWPEEWVKYADWEKPLTREDYKIN